MRVTVDRVDPSLPLPAYASEGATGFDLSSRIDVTITPGQLELIPTNVIVTVPSGYVLLVTLRSSTPQRAGLLCPHGVGVIDRDFSGPHDEVMVQVYNFTRQTVTVARGQRIAQGLLMPIERCEWQARDHPPGPSRGGFGSTG